MRAVVVVPARYASTRYPGKPLVPLKGVGGGEKSLIERSWRAAMEVKGADRVVVATDDARIADHVKAFGGDVVMTSEACENGTARCAEAYKVLAETSDIVVNLQGDAPLTPPWFVEALINELASRPEVAVATPVLRCDAAALSGFLEDRAAGRVGGTTAVFTQDKAALYFSKEVIPYTGKPLTDADDIPVFHHVGVYAYRPEALRQYGTFEEGPLESWEGLEQLRFMENGVPVHCVEVAAEGREFWELNNPVDVERIEMILAKQGQE